MGPYHRTGIRAPGADSHARPRPGQHGPRRPRSGERAGRGQRAERRRLGQLLHEQRALRAHAAALLLAHLQPAAGHGPIRLLLHGTGGERSLTRSLLTPLSTSYARCSRNALVRLLCEGNAVSLWHAH